MSNLEIGVGAFHNIHMGKWNENWKIHSYLIPLTFALLGRAKVIGNEISGRKNQLCVNIKFRNRWFCQRIFLNILYFLIFLLQLKTLCYMNLRKHLFLKIPIPLKFQKLQEYENISVTAKMRFFDSPPSLVTICHYFGLPPPPMSPGETVTNYNQYTGFLMHLKTLRWLWQFILSKIRD